MRWTCAAVAGADGALSLSRPACLSPTTRRWTRQARASAPACCSAPPPTRRRRRTGAAAGVACWAWSAPKPCAMPTSARASAATIRVSRNGADIRLEACCWPATPAPRPGSSRCCCRNCRRKPMAACCWRRAPRRRWRCRRGQAGVQLLQRGGAGDQSLLQGTSGSHTRASAWRPAEGAACGTNCGSCVPELKRMGALARCCRTHPTRVGSYPRSDHLIAITVIKPLGQSRPWASASTSRKSAAASKARGRLTVPGRGPVRPGAGWRRDRPRDRRLLPGHAHQGRDARRDGRLPRRHLRTPARVPTASGKPLVVLPSYNGARRLPVLTPLLAAAARAPRPAGADPRHGHRIQPHLRARRAACAGRPAARPCRRCAARPGGLLADRSAAAPA
jgi:hypothetical protein